LERGMEAAPRERESPMTTTRRKARIVIHRIHRLKVQRDIKAAFRGQQSAISNRF